MSLLTKKEIYSWLNIILHDGFKKNEDSMTIDVNKKLSEDEIDGMLCNVFNILGNKELPHPVTHEDKVALYQNFKLNPNYIPIDGKTLKMDKYGQLYADINEITACDEIVKSLCENGKFLEKVKEYIVPEDVMMDYVELYLLKSPKFIRALTSLVTVIQAMDNSEIEGKPVDVVISEYFEKTNNDNSEEE